MSRRYRDDPAYRDWVDETTRIAANARALVEPMRQRWHLDDVEAPRTRTDAIPESTFRTDANTTIPTISQLQADFEKKSRDAWKNPGHTAPPETPTEVPATPPAATAVRTDATARIPTISELQEAFAKKSREAWKNSGHAPVRQ